MTRFLMASNPSFIELPTEILCEIAGRTNGKALLALRQTCKRLSSITKTQPVWSVIAQDMEAQPGTSRIEKPRAECSAQELEAWALERLRVQDLYNSLSKTIPTHPQCRELTFPTEITDSCLLPGGKRLLAFTRFKGVVYQCDLNSFNGNIRELIPPTGSYNDEAGDDDVRHAIWVDKSQSRLSFRLALYSRFWCSAKGTTRASIYHVTLSSSGTHLEANHNTTFLVSREEAKIAAALDKDRFFLVTKNPTNARTELFVYYYTKPLSPNSRTEIDADTIMKVRLIPNDRLLVICKSTIKIYDLSTAFPNSNRLQSLSPWWQLPGSIILRPKQHTEPIITPNFTRIAIAIIATDGLREGFEPEIIGISIPHGPPYPIPKTFSLVQQETVRDLLYYCSGTMGHYGSIFLDWRCRVYILRYSWDDDDDDDVDNSTTHIHHHSRKYFEKEFTLPHSDYNLAVDKIVGLSEERGRVVLQTGRSNVAVIDLVPNLNL